MDWCNNNNNDDDDDDNDNDNDNKKRKKKKKEQEEEEDMVVSENWVCNFQEKNDEYPQMKYSTGDPLSFLAIFPLVGAIPSNKQNEGNPPRLVSMDWFCW